MPDLDEETRKKGREEIETEIEEAEDGMDENPMEAMARMGQQQPFGQQMPSDKEIPDGEAR